MYEDVITLTTIRNLILLVRPYVLKNSGSMSDVEDTIQEGLFKFMNVYSNKEFVSESKVENYIFVICRNHWLKELEKRNRLKLSGSRIVEEIEDDDWTLKEKKRKELLLQIVERNIKLLSNKCQEVFNFRKEGLSCKEIAELLHLKNSQMVKDKHYRCKERLRNLVKQDKDYWDLINDG